MLLQRRLEDRQLLLGREATESLGGLKHAGGGSAQRHPFGQTHGAVDLARGDVHQHQGHCPCFQPAGLRGVLPTGQRQFRACGLLPSPRALLFVLVVIKAK